MRVLAAGGWFALGAAVTFVAGAAFDVFVLGHTARPKGPQTTFTIFLSLTPVVAFVPAALYVLGARMWKRVPGAIGSVAAGAVLIVLFFIVGAVGERVLPGNFLGPIAWVILIAGSLLAPRLVKEQRHGP